MAILIACDLSPHSGPALYRALQLGRDLALPVEVVYVVDSDLPAPLRDQSVAWAQAALDREVDAALAASDVRPGIKLLVGKAKHEIVERAHAISADLIVLGFHDGAKDNIFSFADTTSGHILRASDLPILLVRAAPLRPYRQALVGVDFSIFAKSAVRHAQRFFPNTALTLVHAYHIPFKLRLGTPEYIKEMTAVAAEEFETFLADEMDILLKHTEERAPGASHIDTCLVEGLPATVLRAQQSKTGAELIVIGTHGASGMTRAIWGSVAQDLLDRAPCDILVVHGFQSLGPRP